MCKKGKERGKENVPSTRLHFTDTNSNTFLHALPSTALLVLDGGVVHWTL